MQSTDVQSLPSNFTSRVDFGGRGGCWQWTGYVMSTGYGQYTISRKHYLAHRVAYELLVASIPAGAFIDHRCFNRSCVNPEHLRAVSNKQNMEHLSGPHRDSSTGLRNVYKCRDKWRVQAGHNGRVVYGGVFDTLDAATDAAAALRARLFTHDDGAL